MKFITRSTVRLSATVEMTENDRNDPFARVRTGKVVVAEFELGRLNSTDRNGRATEPTGLGSKSGRNRVLSTKDSV